MKALDSKKMAGEPGAAALAVGLLVAVAFGALGDDYLVSSSTVFLTGAFMALGLALMWGIGGILSFGQSAFFGVAGYAFSVSMVNIVEPSLSPLCVVVALLVCAGLAALLGYVMFYGGVKDVFIGLVTLAVTLVLETFMAQTAGPEWTIGSARLNGFNGMSGIPNLAIGWGGGSVALEGRTLYFCILGALALSYWGARSFKGSRRGLVLACVRDNPLRAQMLGHDIRRYQLGAFVAGSTLAGLSGILYVAWGQYITPESMGLSAAVAPIIWVVTGGKNSLAASVLGAIALAWLTQYLSIYGAEYALLVMAALLLVSVLATPSGLFLVAGTVLRRLAVRGPRSMPILDGGSPAVGEKS